MKINSKIYPLVIALAFIVMACDNNDDEINLPQTEALELNIQGLENLGSDFLYENWLIVNGSAVSAGLFSVDDNGNLSQTSFEIEPNQLNQSTAYVLTIEPNPDPDPAPSDVHILGGNFNGDTAPATVDHPSAIGNNFLSSTGEYILATPTDGSPDTDENSGVWFFDPATGSATLDLPQLPNGWIYEGWAVIDGQPLSTGTFLSANMADNSAVFSGLSSGPPYPGEDFLMNAPAGLTFPTDLSAGNIVISIEPVPDNSPLPFTLKPLAGMVPSNAVDRVLYSLQNNSNASNPSGTVSR